MTIKWRHIVLSEARPSTCVDGGLDLDIDIPGLPAGEATLLRDERGRWATWGVPENWLSRGLLDALSREQVRELSFQLLGLEVVS